MTNLIKFNKREINVKQHFRKGKIVKASKRKIDKKKLAIKSAIAASSSLGIAATSYLVLKGRYRKGYKKSADFALNLSKNIKVSNLDENINNIHFATGGLNAKSKDVRTGRIFASKLKKIFSKSENHIIAVDTSKSNTNFLGRDYNNVMEKFYESTASWAKPFLIKGYNPTSRDLAAEMFAYHKQYPNKNLILHGFSAGSYINTEALNIFKEMGGNINKVKQVNYVGTYLGINKPNLNNTLSFASKQDWDYTAKKLPYPNTIWIPNKKEHSMSEYLEDSNVRKKINDFLNINEEPKKQVSVISKKSINPSLKEELKQLEERRQKLIKTRNNQKIPKDKKEKALQSAKAELRRVRNRVKTLIKEERKKQNN